MNEIILESKSSFSEKIIKFAQLNELHLLDALTEYCRNKRVEIEEVENLLTNEFKAMLYKEAVNLNMFRQQNVKVQFDE
jgi:hypothetical protein